MAGVNVFPETGEIAPGMWLICLITVEFKPRGFSGNRCGYIGLFVNVCPRVVPDSAKVGTYGNHASERRRLCQCTRFVILKGPLGTRVKGEPLRCQSVRKTRDK